MTGATYCRQAMCSYPSCSCGVGLPKVRIGDVVAITRYIDWKVVVEDINLALGLELTSRVKVAELLNVPQSTVQRWLEPQRSGADRQVRDIGYAHGEALLELHRRLRGPEETLKRLREFRERATRLTS